MPEGLSIILTAVAGLYLWALSIVLMFLVGRRLGKIFASRYLRPGQPNDPRVSTELLECAVITIVAVPCGVLGGTVFLRQLSALFGY